MLSPSPSPTYSPTPKEASVEDEAKIEHEVEAEVELQVEKETEQWPTLLPHQVNRWKRARIGKCKQVLLPTEGQLKGHLKFTTKGNKEKCKILSSRPVLACKYIHHPTMEELKIKDFVLELNDNIGWKNYFDINFPGYIELVREFYTTFVLDIPSRNFTLSSAKVVRFRSMGKSFKLPMTGFNLALGLISEEYTETDLQSACDYLDDFHPITLYTTLTKCSSAFHDPSNSKDAELRDPA